MTATELLAIARREKPHVRYAAHKSGNAIAAWHDERWITVASKAITGEWVCCHFELLVNGKPMHKPEDWQE